MENKNAAAFVSSAGTDERQPNFENNNIITENSTNGNSENEYSHSMLMREIDPYYLYTVPMTQLFDNIYGSKQPVIDNFLYAGTYLFAGAPKIGKSFFMAQLAYHVSMGIPMWEYPVHQGTVLYLALEDTYARLQSRLSRMFGTDNNDNLHFATKANNLSDDLDKQLESFMAEHRDTKLIIIDTLQKIREAAGENYSYDELEKKCGLIEQRIENYKQSEEQALEKSKTIDVENILPEPSLMMSVKAYKKKIEPIFKKLVGIIKTLVRKVYELQGDNRMLRQEAEGLRVSNNELKSQLWDYRMKKSKMEVELRKFDKIKKHFGAETVKRWLDEIKKSKKKIRTEETR